MRCCLWRHSFTRLPATLPLPLRENELYLCLSNALTTSWARDGSGQRNGQENNKFMPWNHASWQGTFRAHVKPCSLLLHAPRSGSGNIARVSEMSAYADVCPYGLFAVLATALHLSGGAGARRWQKLAKRFIHSATEEIPWKEVFFFVDEESKNNETKSLQMFTEQSVL
uniref:Uncharacterized protein n=1 Tax=Anopheles melas TaxID=34690 RepID=A0A182U2Q7_9DIPT